MALITITELEDYANNYKSGDGAAAIKSFIVNAASSVVTDYLGYDPISAERVYRTVGVGYNEILLPIPVVTSITSVSVDDELLDAADYELVALTVKSLLRLKNNYIPRRGAQIVITYVAGWEAVPDQVKLAALRIGALMLSETEGNIGITSKTFADMSKQFISYTNYNKYLQPLAPYRAEVI